MKCTSTSRPTEVRVMVVIADPGCIKTSPEVVDEGIRIRRSDSEVEP